MITVMGIRAHKSKIPFADITATVLKVMGTDPRRITEIQVEVVVGDDWNENQRKLMEQVALNCPVAQSLSPELIQNVRFVYTN